MNDDLDAIRRENERLKAENGALLDALESLLSAYRQSRDVSFPCGFGDDELRRVEEVYRRSKGGML